MIDYLERYIENVSGSEEAIVDLIKFYKGLSSDLKNLITERKNSFFSGKTDYTAILDELKETAIRENVNYFQLSAVFVLECFKETEKIYEKNKIDKKMYWQTAADVFYKLRECKKVYGVYGTFVAHWDADFFRLKRFAFGRLQCECVKFPATDCRINGHIIKAEEKVLNIHIPSSGHIEREDISDSLKTAYTFFGFKGIMTVICNSWLLFPAYHQLYPENSRLRKFFDMFQIIKSVKSEEGKFPDGWRVFGVQTDKSNYNALEENTTLQKNFKKYLLSGNFTGSGLGVMFFDGEKII